MASGQTARKEWGEPGWAAVERAHLASIPGGRSGERPAAHAFGELKTIACWSLMLGGGVAVWAGAIYGFLRLLTGPFS
jgi:hypothetical protein